MWETKRFVDRIDFRSIFFPPCYGVGLVTHIPQNILYCVQQNKEIPIGTKWGWVNDDIISFFGWTAPLTLWSNKTTNNSRGKVN